MAEVVDLDQFKPAPEELVVADHDDVFRVMDLHDEEQILDELQGRALDVMVYDFGSGRDRQTGLSYAGVAEAARTANARKLSRVRIVPGSLSSETVEIDGLPTLSLTVYAEDEHTGGGQYGTATCSLKMRRNAKDGSGKQIYEDDPNNPGRQRKQTYLVDDRFARAKALSKAQRNAMLPLIPLQIRETLIAMYLQDTKRVRTLRVGDAKGAERPPALDDPQARQQISRLTELYAKVKAIPGGRVRFPPARFNSWMLDTQHSHERLDQFIGHLEQELEQLEKENQ